MFVVPYMRGIPDVRANADASGYTFTYGQNYARKATTLKYSTLVEIVAAVHLSKYVQAPFHQRSGLFLVSPPGGFKTTITETMDEFAHTQIISDINVQSLTRMRDLFLSGTVSTMAFSDFGKLYKRHGATAENVEGIIMALADEGFRKPSFKSQATGTIPAQCTVIGGMTTAFFESKTDDWIDNGFMRRFLFAQYKVSNLEIIEDAIGEWRRAALAGAFVPKVPSLRSIPYKLESHEVELIRYYLRHSMERVGSFVMLQKIFCVLKWKFAREPGKAEFILKDFAPCLSKNGGVLQLAEIGPNGSNPEKVTKVLSTPAPKSAKLVSGGKQK
jgi:hypothetical protein